MKELENMFNELVRLLEHEDYNQNSDRYKIIEQKIFDITNNIYLYLDGIRGNQINQLESVLKKYEFELYWNFPVPVSFKIYSKAFIKGSKDPDLLKQFALYIGNYGPDWDEESKMILELINENKIDEAVKIAKTVKY